MRILLLISLFVCSSFVSIYEPDTEPPNIVIILLDDSEEYDIRAWGGNIDTPWMDFLSTGGKMFKNAYANPVCSPSRAALTTGLYPQRAGLTNLSSDITAHPTQLGHVNLQYQMISEYLQGAGYETYMSGKWHLGKNDHPSQPFEGAGGASLFEPLDRGFDEWSGFLGSQANPYGSTLYLVNDVSIGASNPATFYQSDWIGDEAVRYVNQANDPFYLYVPFGAPHVPLGAPQDGVLLQKYLDRFSSYGNLSDLCYEYNEAQGRAGLVDCKSAARFANSELTPKSQNALNDPELLLDYATHAAMIEQADINIGKIIQAVDAKGELDNTMFILTADNGSDANGINGTWNCQRGLKGSSLEGGIAVYHSVFWQGKIKPGITEQKTHLIDVFPTVEDIVNDCVPVNSTNTFDGISYKNTLYYDQVIPRCLWIEWNDIAAVFLENCIKYFNDFRPNNSAIGEELHNASCDAYEDTNIIKTNPDAANEHLINGRQKLDDFHNEMGVLSRTDIQEWEDCYPLSYNSITGLCE